MNVKAKIFSWDNGYIFNASGWDLKVGDTVIVNFDSGLENAKISELKPTSESNDKEIPKIIRRANIFDLEICQKNRKKEIEALEVCREMAKKRKLIMKIVDAHFSFDGGKITFSFIAEKRVDFRDLVKDLSKKFQKSIRLQQIGSRDEAKGKGGFGICGEKLCCMRFSAALQSVTIEDAKAQQMGQRGSERLSGLCDRLRCCLGFESGQYRENLKKFPKNGQGISYEKRKGIATDRNIMTEQVTIESENGNKKKVSLKDIKF